MTRPNRQVGTTSSATGSLWTWRTRRGEERVGEPSQGICCTMRVFLAGLLLKRGWRRRRRNWRGAVIDIEIVIAGTAVAAGRGEVGGQTRKVRHDGRWAFS